MARAGDTSRLEAARVTFASLVRERRRQLGMTMEDVGLRAGCAKSYVSALENGQKPPPSDDLLARLEDALQLPRARLAEVAWWERTPAGVRREVALMKGEQDRRDRLVSRLRELIGPGGSGGGSLDEAHRSGELRRLVDLLAPPAGEALPASMAREVPVINSVAAGYPREFTDLGYPARIADEYVRCPDVTDPDAFGARVVGDSMSPQYAEGDIVVFSPARPVVGGADCFARLERDGETTFKRVYFERDGAGREVVRLQPLNASYAPRTLAREEVAGLYAAVQVVKKVG